MNHLPCISKNLQKPTNIHYKAKLLLLDPLFFGSHGHTSLSAAGYEELLTALRGLCSETVPESGTSTFDFVHLPWKLTLIFSLGLAKMSPIRLKTLKKDMYIYVFVYIYIYIYIHIFYYIMFLFLLFLYIYIYVYQMDFPALGILVCRFAWSLPCHIFRYQSWNVVM